MKALKCSFSFIFPLSQPLSYAYNSANSTNQPLTRYRLDYDRNQPQLSSADANFDKGDRSLPYFADRSNYSAYDGGGGGGHYLDYLGKR